MEVAVRLATARACGGPVGTGDGGYMHAGIGYSLCFLYCRNSKQVRVTTESKHEVVDCYLANDTSQQLLNRGMGCCGFSYAASLLGPCLTTIAPML